MTTFMQALDQALAIADDNGFNFDEMTLWLSPQAHAEMRRYIRVNYRDGALRDRYFGVLLRDHPYIPNQAILQMHGTMWRAIIEGRPQ